MGASRACGAGPGFPLQSFLPLRGKKVFPLNPLRGSKSGIRGVVLFIRWNIDKGNMKGPLCAVRFFYNLFVLNL
jgi:hypothetical protein